MFCQVGLLDRDWGSLPLLIGTSILWTQCPYVRDRKANCSLYANLTICCSLYASYSKLYHCDNSTSQPSTAITQMRTYQMKISHTQQGYHASIGRESYRPFIWQPQTLQRLVPNLQRLVPKFVISVSLCSPNFLV